ncbi:hypothetical protein [Nonomuraea gerenzanensis]|uniref:Uncharacterized protein n=1 Tax=Nonomuraea gerenzanensis TaxID=93944 RepID=A0A1M4EDB3_9ACTN|nr:hypothetical protein [Nonomuraea gerenzanensis]UBU18703.1 hypothetical protein LCN96_27910 [Nonomuraea gerenzanensis]SBO96563.1 hypothetical protein BN4615_P6079 [Nonomuraea gerenzanensis]
MTNGFTATGLRRPREVLAGPDAELDGTVPAGRRADDHPPPHPRAERPRTALARNNVRVSFGTPTQPVEG